MTRLTTLVLFFAFALSSAFACDDDPAQARAVKEQTRALEDQAKSMERQERLLKQQNKILDQQRRNSR